MSKYEMTLEIGEVDLVIEADVTRGRPAPIAYDHDSAAFSDPGDPAEVEITSIRLARYEYTSKNTRKTVLSEDIKDFLSDDVFEQIQEKLFEQSAEDTGPDPDAAYEMARDEGRV